jgi:replicative DNA helicase
MARRKDEESIQREPFPKGCRLLSIVGVSRCPDIFNIRTASFLAAEAKCFQHMSRYVRDTTLAGEPGMRETITKVPPQNIEAERALLGSMMIEKEAILEAINIVDKDSFYENAHSKLFQVIISLYDKNKAVDIVTVSEELKKLNLLEAVGGAAYLTDLIDSVATAANIEYYSKIVKEKSTLRKLISAANKIITDSYSDNEEVDDLMDKAEQAVLDVCQDRLRTGFIPLSDMIHDSIEEIEKLHNKKDHVPGVPSGFTKLDELTAGFHPSNLIIVAARPSMGKTSFCLNVAEHVAIKKKKTVAIFSLEMSKEELLLRMLCSQSKVNSRDVRTGYFHRNDWAALTNSAGLLSTAPIYIDDSPSLSVLEMKSRARRLQAEHGLDMIIIDYLQLMAGRTGRSEYRQQDVSEISRSLKVMAKDLKVPVIAVSQLSRETERRESKRPVLSDLRESGSIEQDADLVLFIYREEVYKPDETEKKGMAEIIIGKHRNGPPGKVELTFLLNFTRFENSTKQSEE